MHFTVSEHSIAGIKTVNQDYCLSVVPDTQQLLHRGAVFVICDGISSSDVSQYASQLAADEFAKQYYAASLLWSPIEAANLALQYCNFKLFSKTQSSEYRDNPDRGYVCTFVALIVLPEQFFVMHLGDSRCYLRSNERFSQVTQDQVQTSSHGDVLLSNALGHKSSIAPCVFQGATEAGLQFLLTTDGVHDVLGEAHISSELTLSNATIATRLVNKALKNGSKDNLSAIAIKVESTGAARANAVIYPLSFLPVLDVGERIDGLTIIDVLHRNHRSHVYLVKPEGMAKPIVLKTPSVEYENDANYIQAFKHEEWITQRIDSPYVVKTADVVGSRTALYSLYEHISAQSLPAWLNDKGSPTLSTVRHIASQLANGIQALHRQDTLHRDIRPQNILVDENGKVTLIDLGCASVENHITTLGLNHMDIPGTAMYTAPEYFLGEPGSQGSDIYSLGVLIYHLLSGEFPYGSNVARATSYGAQLKLKYTSLLSPDRELPVWVDETLKKATHIDPNKRYSEVSEFIHDLHQPNPRFLKQYQRPLLERKPVQFWQTVSAGLFIIICILIATR